MIIRYEKPSDIETIDFIDWPALFRLNFFHLRSLVKKAGKSMEHSFPGLGVKLVTSISRDIN